MILSKQSDCSKFQNRKGTMTITEERNVNENNLANGGNERMHMSILNRSHSNETENAEGSVDTQSKKWDYLLNIATKVVKWQKNNETEEQRRFKWKNRRIRLASRFPGGLKSSEEDKVDNTSFLSNDPKLAIGSWKKPSVFQYAKEGIFGRGQDKVDSASVILNAVLDRDEQR